MIRNVLFCGVGGQGILLAAKILATAAELGGFEVATNEIHGMAQRGGSVTAQLRFGDAVASPLILEGTADVLASLEAMEALRCAHWLKPGGLAAVAREIVVPVTVSTGKAKVPEDLEERLTRVFPNLKYLDFADGAGERRLGNTFLLGVLSVRFPELEEGRWREAIEQCVKPEFVEKNIAAFEKGRLA